MHVPKHTRTLGKEAVRVNPLLSCHYISFPCKQPVTQAVPGKVGSMTIQNTQPTHNPKQGSKLRLPQKKIDTYGLLKGTEKAYPLGVFETNHPWTLTSHHSSLTSFQNSVNLHKDKSLLSQGFLGIFWIVWGLGEVTVVPTCNMHREWVPPCPHPYSLFLPLATDTCTPFLHLFCQNLTRLKVGSLGSWPESG